MNSSVSFNGIDWKWEVPLWSYRNRNCLNPTINGIVRGRTPPARPGQAETICKNSPDRGASAGDHRQKSQLQRGKEQMQLQKLLPDSAPRAMFSSQAA